MNRPRTLEPRSSQTWPRKARARALVAVLCLPLGTSAGGQLITERTIIDPEPDHPRCHASTIVESPPGSNRMVAAWFGGTGEKHPDVGIWVSVREPGGTWSKSVEVTNGVRGDERFPTWNPVLVHTTGDAPLQLFYKVGPSPDTWWGEVMRSRDGGASWSATARLPNDLIGPVRAKPLQLAGGRLVSGASTEHDGWKVHFELSDDGGETWRFAEPPDHLGDRAAPFGVIQPALIRHEDGRIQALCRSQQNRIVETWSSDRGQTWSPLEATSLPNPSAGVDAVTLQDGRHLLIYNHTERSRTSRSKLNLALTRDGKSWDAVVLLEDQPGEYSYPAIIQTADGMVHLTYTYRRERIQHVVLDPAKIETRPIEFGVWPDEVGTEGVR